MKKLLHNAFFKPILVITGAYLLAFGTHAVARQCLTGDVTYYFATTGSNSNDGLSWATAWATPQHAVDYVNTSIDLCGYSVTIRGADGAYPPFVVSGPFVGARSASSVKVQCNVANPNQCSISASNGIAILVQYDAAVTIEGFQVAATGGVPFGRGVLVDNAFLRLGAMGYATCDEAHINAGGPRAMLQLVGDQVIYGDSANHVLSEAGALVAYNGRIVNIITSVTFGRAFAQATERGEIDFTNSGFVLGQNVSVSGPPAKLQSFGLIKGSSTFLLTGNALPGSGAVINENNEGLFK